MMARSLQITKCSWVHERQPYIFINFKMLAFNNYLSSRSIVAFTCVTVTYLKQICREGEVFWQHLLVGAAIYSSILRYYILM